jgi:hypothetical protein
MPAKETYETHDPHINVDLVLVRVEELNGNVAALTPLRELHF